MVVAGIPQLRHIPTIGFAPLQRVCALLRLSAVGVDEAAGLGAVAGLD
jgi:hypothetical protein